jgi:hypothetical protein
MTTTHYVSVPVGDEEMALLRELARRELRTPGRQAAELVRAGLRDPRPLAVEAARRHLVGLQRHLEELGLRGEAAAVRTALDLLEPRGGGAGDAP